MADVLGESARAAKAAGADIDGRPAIGDLGPRDLQMKNARKLLPSIAVVTLALLFGPAGALAQGGNAAKGTSEFTAQKKKKAAPKRAPTRIVVRRALPYYLEASIYPRPDDVSWPGPDAVRECTSWLAREYRPSGTVVVPRMRCWWQSR